MTEIKRIKINKEMIEYIQKLYEDYRSKQDLIAYIFELHKRDDDDSIISSIPFLSYEKKFAEIKLAYDTGMRIIQKDYIPEEYKKTNYNFEVDFDNEELVIVEY